MKLPSFRALFDHSLIAAAALLSLAVSAHLALKPRDPANGIALVFAPWSSEQATFLGALESGGRFVRFGGLPFIAVVMPENSQTKLNAVGAWFVADPKAIAACLEWAGRKSS